MSIADKLQTLAENEQRISNEVGDQADLIAQISSVIDEKLAGGGGEEPVNKLAGVVDGTIKELTAEDLAGATKIRSYAFYKVNSLTSIEIPDSVTLIDKYAFEYCDSLTSVVIGDSVTSIGSYAFYGCSKLKNITIPDSVTTIGDRVFWECVSLESVVIPNGVTKVLEYTFYGCSSLTSVVIPNGVTSIAAFAFNSCTSLKRVDCSKHTKVPTLGATNAFNKTHSTLQIKVPADLIDSWKTATNWSTYASQIVTEFTNEV